jgi:hypothetical protein
MNASTAAVGAAVLHIMEHSGEPLKTAMNWLLDGSISVVTICVALLAKSLRLNKLHFPGNQIPDCMETLFVTC